MAADGDDNQQPDVQRAVDAGSDLSHGSERAFDALMFEVSKAHQQLANDPAAFNKFGQAVADGLKQKGSLEEMSECFAKNDIPELAHTNGEKIKEDDLNSDLN